MNKTILTIFKVLSIVFIALAVILQVLVLSNSEEELAGSSIIDNFAYLSYVAIGLTTLLAILFPIIFIIQNPKNALKILISLVVLIGIGFICYSLATSQFSLEDIERLKTTAEVEKMVGASMFFTYIVGGLAILSILYSGISSIFK
ncbi:MAG: hypothetical protein JXA03_10640 [Bacteroidales bacterium]|nr:hypothetical protein [Bacteroidales bacterium]